MIESRLLQRNIEIKARCPELGTARRAALKFGAKPAGVLMQIDTYFVVPSGRLKLRQIKDAADQLIYYHRPDSAAPKQSRYWPAQLAGDAETLKAVLEAALGVGAIVHKRRELLLWRNVRIHLDQVENLGDFIELEAVIDPSHDESASRQNLDEIASALSIRPQELVANSYGEMISAG